MVNAETGVAEVVRGFNSAVAGSEAPDFGFVRVAGTLIGVGAAVISNYIVVERPVNTENGEQQDSNNNCADDDPNDG